MCVEVIQEIVIVLLDLRFVSIYDPIEKGSIKNPVIREMFKPTTPNFSPAILECMFSQFFIRFNFNGMVNLWTFLINTIFPDYQKTL